jgi:hypothetical protein
VNFPCNAPLGRRSKAFRYMSKLPQHIPEVTDIEKTAYTCLQFYISSYGPLIVKEDEIGGACSTNGGEEECI